ncbi:hypothetical protein [Sphingomonas alpina]|uniref:Uncharacterized protein n=1 Tax=Sphingomonas alpina TaxID=653931 RepID=A0A7H0LNM0_9SPHN|nr:hypothetical protein [Sphingomonas alpina]QNQ11273.1 hypothetical protein H3Z74_09045 [Sphingomonas alpina]
MTKRRIGLTAAITLWAGMGATGVQAAEAAAKPCVTPAEASGLMLFIAPDAIKAVGETCATVLPADALLRQTSGAFIDKYRAEADSAWPSAKAALAKIAGDEMKPALENDSFKPMIASLMAPVIAKDIKPKDCAQIDRIVTLIAPLPPRNAAELIVTLVQLSGEKKENSKLPVCPAGRN